MSFYIVQTLHKGCICIHGAKQVRSERYKGFGSDVPKKENILG